MHQELVRVTFERNEPTLTKRAIPLVNRDHETTEGVQCSANNAFALHPYYALKDYGVTGRAERSSYFLFPINPNKPANPNKPIHE